MPDENGNWGFADYLGAGLGIAATLGIAYATHKSREEQINRLLSMSYEQAVQVVIEIVPPMDNDTWQDFQYRLSEKARYSVHAENLLYLAKCIVIAEKEVYQLLEYSMQEIMNIIPGLLRNKDYTQQLAFLVGLKSNGSLKAQSILGNLLNS